MLPREQDVSSRTSEIDFSKLGTNWIRLRSDKATQRNPYTPLTARLFGQRREHGLQAILIDQQSLVTEDDRRVSEIIQR
jgi:hypothetical protein